MNKIPENWRHIDDHLYERTDGAIVQESNGFWMARRDNGRQTVVTVNVPTVAEAMALADGYWPLDRVPGGRPGARPVSAETANALVTEAPLTSAELTALRLHFEQLSGMLKSSGPRFSGPHRDAVDMHNRTIRRLRGIRDEQRRRETMAAEDDLLEISR